MSQEYVPHFRDGVQAQLVALQMGKLLAEIDIDLQPASVSKIMATGLSTLVSLLHEHETQNLNLTVRRTLQELEAIEPLVFTTDDCLPGKSKVKPYFAKAMLYVGMEELDKRDLLDIGLGLKSSLSDPFDSLCADPEHSANLARNLLDSMRLKKSRP